MKRRILPVYHSRKERVKRFHGVVVGVTELIPESALLRITL